MHKLLLYAGLFLFFSSSDVLAQHYIGLEKKESKVLARNSGFYYDNMTVNQKFNYLKFVNNADTKTLIIFFDEDDIALHTRMVCDYSEWDFVLDELNEQFKKKDKFIWEYKKDGTPFTISLEEKEWYFVLRTKKK